MATIVGKASAPPDRSLERRDQPFRAAATVSIAMGVLLVTFNGLRPVSAATYGDLFFVLGAGFITLHLLASAEPLPRIPRWLAGAAYAMLGIGILSALLAPGVTPRPLTNSYGEQVTLPVATDFGANIVPAVQFPGTLFFAPLLIGIVANSRPRLERILDVWLLAAAVNGLIALSDAFHLTSIGLQVTGLPFSQLGRETGLTLHPNHLATVAAMALPVAFARAATARSPVRRWLSWGAVGVIAAAVGISGARAGLLAGAIGVVLVVLLQRHGRGRMIAGVAAGGAALVLLMNAFGSGPLEKLSVGLDRLVGGQTDPALRADASDAARQQSYESAIETIREHPVTGTGYEGLREAHDLYLQLLQGGGVLLLLAFAVFAVGALRMGYRLSRDARLAPDLQSVAGASMVSMAVWLMAGVVQNPLYDRYLYIPLGVLLGLQFLVSRGPRDQDQI